MYHNKKYSCLMCVQQSVYMAALSIFCQPILDF
uniref:Uncharacterized protein n=1 Tax=Arundo donax TaxID=35708 RepID=A0A0A9B365_ARUDO